MQCSTDTELFHGALTLLRCDTELILFAIRVFVLTLLKCDTELILFAIFVLTLLRCDTELNIVCYICTDIATMFD